MSKILLKVGKTCRGCPHIIKMEQYPHGEFYCNVFKVFVTSNYNSLSLSSIGTVYSTCRSLIISKEESDLLLMLDPDANNWLYRIILFDMLRFSPIPKEIFKNFTACGEAEKCLPKS